MIKKPPKDRRVYAQVLPARKGAQLSSLFNLGSREKVRTIVDRSEPHVRPPFYSSDPRFVRRYAALGAALTMENGFEISAASLRL